MTSASDLDDRMSGFLRPKSISGWHDGFCFRFEGLDGDVEGVVVMVLKKFFCLLVIGFLDQSLAQTAVKISTSDCRFKLSWMVKFKYQQKVRLEPGLADILDFGSTTLPPYVRPSKVAVR